MGKPTGFLEYDRRAPDKAPIHERVKHFGEFETLLPVVDLQTQGARCMDCGTPFCMAGCPLGNLIPEWNDLVYKDDWRVALDQLHATNNFPEFTGRTCPAPCESACVLGINAPAVTIKSIENALVERGWQEGWIHPEPPTHRTGKRVAIVGSGPAGLAAAQQLNRAGHLVTVFERDDRVGGLLVYGIPNFKLEKNAVERRVNQLRAEGIEFRTSVNVGVDVTVSDLKRSFDAVVLAIGSTVPRDVPVEGRTLSGVVTAMEYLTQQNRIDCGDAIADEERISAHGKHVVVIGGGDTASDCIGTANRQGAASVTQLDIHGRGLELAGDGNPWWPLVPLVFTESSSQEEGCKRLFTVVTQRFVDDGFGNVKALEAVKVGRSLRREERLNVQSIKGEKLRIPTDLVLLAVGFSYPEYPLLGKLGVETTKSGTVAVSKRFATSQQGVFAAGDCTRGASLVVWAIAEGRNVARSVDEYLMGESSLPAPLEHTMVVDRHDVLVY
jgi:glutamate synthase (NADPH/NADH) small chain